LRKVKSLRILADIANQHLNIAVPDPDPAPGKTSEEMIGHLRYIGLKRALELHGHTVIYAHICGVGSSSVDELVRALDLGFAAKPDACVSLHSDASGPQDIYPLVCRDVDKPFARAVGTDLAQAIGFAYQGRETNRIGNLGIAKRAYKYLKPQRFVLLEIGVHGYWGGDVYGMEGTKALWTFAMWHGFEAGISFLKGLGWLKAGVDSSVPVEFLVAPGFEWRQAKPVAEVIPAYTRMLEVTDAMRGTPVPFMRGDDVRWAQQQVNKVLPAGTILKRWDGQTRYAPMSIDSVYGYTMEAGVLASQKILFPGEEDEWDGIVGPKTWGALQGVK
jgi:hypothetical protein